MEANSMYAFYRTAFFSLLLFTLGALLGGGAVYLYLTSNKPYSDKFPGGEAIITPAIQQKSLPGTEKFTCTKDDDCVVGIIPAECCSCPVAINRNFIGQDEWVLFESGKSYDEYKSDFCNNIFCVPCGVSVIQGPPICSEGLCQAPIATVTPGRFPQLPMDLP